MARQIRGYPKTSDRSRGWLRYLYRKATTPDNWDKEGEPNAHWDNITGEPRASWHRFDLLRSSYSMALMADATPAWREVYGHVLDELISRYTGYWAAKDWLEQIGDDPRREQYPEEWYQTLIPSFLRGKYDVPGWTANGVEPWGLQMDPIDADGNLFFKGDFLILLGLHVYVTGDEKWNQSFMMVRDGANTFAWTHSRIAEHLYTQLSTRPEGCHCENTKIWPICMTRAGLGLGLHDLVYGSDYRPVYDAWWEYAKRNYLSILDGKIVGSVTMYYDPLVGCHHSGDHEAMMKLGPAQMVLAYQPDDARILFEAAAEQLNWRSPESLQTTEGGLNAFDVVTGMFLAREFGDDALFAKLRAFSEANHEPTWHDATGEFTWRFRLDEPHPRGQLNAAAAMAEAAGRNAWSDLINAPNFHKFLEPSVYGVDFPRVCLSQASYDVDRRLLVFATDAGAPGAAGEPTTLRVTNVAPDACVVEIDGARSDDWRVIDGDIEVSTTVGEHSFVMRCG